MVSKIIHSELLRAQKKIYEPAGIVCAQIAPDAESQEYGACTFVINNKRVVFRVAKITPTKIGQFVTFWKRVKGVIMPYDASDDFDLFVVNVSKNGYFGQFVFPKEVLVGQGVISINGKGGRRAIRVYPAWDITESKQAQATQAWQSYYFFEINEDKPFDETYIQQLYYEKIIR